MRRRYLYVLLFAVPALLAAMIGTALAAGAAVGMLWLFVFGDNPWPGWIEHAVAVGALGTGLVFYAALLSLAYAIGRQEESRLAINRTHVALAVGSTAALLFLVALRLGGIRFTPLSDDEVCADVCREQGFSASAMPPRISGDRTCSCYDAQGRVAHRVPLPPRE